jgi:phage/plasmid-associated DNA primase
MRKAATQAGSGQQIRDGHTLPATDPERSLQRFASEHLRKIRESALDDAQIEALTGWRTLQKGQLEIPYLKPDGSPERCHDGKPFRRWRLSEKQLAAAKAKGEIVGKYLSPSDNGCRLYHSAIALAAGNYPERLQDRFTELRITEGELKTEAANAHDPERLTVGLGGVNSWRDRYDGGDESRPLVDFDEIPMNGRCVRLCFDSDHRKPQVAAALRGLAEFLADQGACVLIEVLPNGLDGERLGLDDLIYRHGPEVFLEVAAIARSPFRYRQSKGETVRDWAFNPQPLNTRERNVYLFGMLGRHWRSSLNGKDHWQRWAGTHWEEVAGDDTLAREMEQFAVLQEWQNRELPALRSLQAAFRRSIEPGSSGGADGLLPFRNGCLVLGDRHRLVAHDPEHGNTWALPFDYNHAATCPGIEKLLLDRLGDVSAVALFRAYCRALLTGERLKCFLEITGPSNTGKSVLGNLLKALVGGRNTAACTLQRLEDRSQRFETAKLAGKRLAIFSECQDYSGQLQTLKALTGGDPIPAEIKGGRHFDFTYSGGVLLVGNGPIRASDPTGAVINRRRSLSVTKVVPASKERRLLDPDGSGGWSGELVDELPGMVNWALAMPAVEADQALSRDVRTVSRAEAKLEMILSDLLAEWADHYLIWDPQSALRVGSASDSPEDYLFPSYLRFMEQQGRNSRPLSLKVFKSKLVDLLRDTLGLSMPSGASTGGAYRMRGLGSVVPCVRWRCDREGDAPGVIRYAVMAELSGTDAERVGNRKTPAGNGWNGRNGSKPVAHKEAISIDSSPSKEERAPVPVPSVPSVPDAGSQRSAAVPSPALSVPQGTAIEVMNAKTGEWEPGWQQIGAGKGSASVLCRNPQGHSKLIGKKEIRPAQEVA